METKLVNGDYVADGLGGVERLSGADALLGRVLYRLTARLDPEAFLRISHSVVIARSKVVRIAPTLSMKFILTLRDGRTVDVTRSYYYIFKETFGI